MPLHHIVETTFMSHGGLVTRVDALATRTAAEARRYIAKNEAPAGSAVRSIGTKRWMPLLECWEFDYRA